jgi:sugar phosphate isomerase/epimerase
MKQEWISVMKCTQGEDIFDGETYEMFLEAVDNHPRACILYDPSHFVLQQLDYMQYIDFYHEKIKAFHVKDAEFNPNWAARHIWWVPILVE